ncbi:hypothetical protein SNEBB_002215, partial [Xyrichtys novacula]
SRRWEGDEEAQKRTIILTAAKLIKSDIKTTVVPIGETYPTLAELNLNTALDFIPPSLRFLLQHLFVGKDTTRKIAGIGQAVVQAVRPRAVIAPLQLGLAVQMHHLYRSRFLMDSLSTMWFASSYPEVQRFEENAACSLAEDVLGDVEILNQSLLFAADNVDHNIITLDGKGSFHGMGMIAAITPGKQVSYGIPRQKMAELKVVERTKIDIIEYRYTLHVNRNIEFQALSYTSDVCDRKVDICWEMSFQFRQSTPSWNGMMHLLHKECEYPGKSSVQFLPMIDMNPGDKTCILSTLDYLCSLSSKHNMPTIISLDQPLFWKASEIVNAVPDDSPIRNVILLLGRFHTFMNLLGAIGSLMDGSGLKEIMETVYGENAVVHIMSGKAVQQAFRGHLLVYQCLTRQIVVKILEDDPGFQDQVDGLERLYMQMETGECDLESLFESDCVRTIHNTLALKKDDLARTSKTSKLWVNYQHILGIARALVAADRMGSWEMHLGAVSACLLIFAAAGHTNYLKSAHLYLQKMHALKEDNPEVHQKFQSGFHVIRRRSQYWAGLGSDLVIEQTLMRSLKTPGGLTRGSGMSEHQRTVWAMSSTVSSAYNLAIQELTTRNYTTAEQHKELSTSRVTRDEADLGKTAEKLDNFTPFSADESLRNIITGINANEDINVQDLSEIGKDVQKMDGQSVFSYSHKRSLKVKTLASSKNVKVSEDRSIDPALLFQRFLVVSQTGDLRLDKVMSYELCLYPMSLFEGKHILRQSDKPQLAEAIRNYVKTKSATAVTQTVPVTEQYVLDGGSLLHCLKWTEGSTYSLIAEHYTSFTVKHYGRATVVFDGYGDGPSIKNCTHQRRSQKLKANKVNITEVTKFVGKKENFLSNGANKQALIQLIMERMRQNGCNIIQAEGDADVEIAKAAISMSAFRPTTLIGEDPDLLVLLLYHADASKCVELYFCSDKAKSHVYNIKVLKQVLGEAVCNDRLFLHAFTGCDSVSRVFGIGKKVGFQRIIKKEKAMKDCSKAFSTPKQS